MLSGVEASSMKRLIFDCILMGVMKWIIKLLNLLSVAAGKNDVLKLHEPSFSFSGLPNLFLLACHLRSMPTKKNSTT